MSTSFEYTIVDPDDGEEVLIEFHYMPHEFEDFLLIYKDGPKKPSLRLSFGIGMMGYIEGVFCGEYLIKGRGDRFFHHLKRE